jgi:hypothetical protein
MQDSATLNGWRDGGRPNGQGRGTFCPSHMLVFSIGMEGAFSSSELQFSREELYFD